MAESGDYTLTAEANKKICQMAKKEATMVLGKVLQTSSSEMKDGFNLKDH